MRTKLTNAFSALMVAFLLAASLTVFSSTPAGIYPANPSAVAMLKALPASHLLPASVKDDLEKAKKDGKAVFLVITGLGVLDVSPALNAAQQASKKVEKSAVIQMDRDDFGNSELVKKYGLASVPLPFVMVVSPRGFAVGGLPASAATADLLVRLVPSPRYDEVLAALNSKKPVYVVASRSSFSDKAAALKACKKSASKVTSGPEIVEVNMDDAAEQGFLKQLGIKTTSTATVTVVINTTGNITGNFSGVPEIQALSDAAVKVVKSCCPSGGTSGCKPTDCKK